MSDKIVREIRSTVGRGCGLAALALGGLMCGLAREPLGDPFLALKAGTIGALVAAFALCHEARRPMADAKAGLTRRTALRIYAMRFALLSAACSLLSLAGEANLWLYPV
ncbi:hypothetical protein [Salinarimonas soli]|uniref:Uncharacterized protein n=1 Tax=Salinarimonas soli TaxID=1638099 RepID=A0A5B2VTY9_9HYPH|nr:hypothetical protein [Salinarimonas soli]KAA2242068.1 hypothetical protein F0L46_03640 [Salinarimonas soli]